MRAVLVAAVEVTAADVKATGVAVVTTGGVDVIWPGFGELEQPIIEKKSTMETNKVITIPTDFCPIAYSPLLIYVQ